MQSILLILSQLALLTLCLHYRPHLPLSSSPSAGDDPPGRTPWPKQLSRRPFNLWAWPELGTYLEFLAGLIGVLGVLQVVLGRWEW